jgi:hypothetical protein
MVYGGSQFTFGFATTGRTTGGAVGFAGAAVALAAGGTTGVATTGADTDAGGSVTAGAALALAVAAASAPFVIEDLRELDVAAERIRAEADLYGTVPDAIEAGGGEEAIKACGRVFTGAFQTQAVAWYMHIHEMQSEIFAYPPGTTISPSYSALSRDPRFPTIATTRKWVIGSSCAG